MQGALSVRRWGAAPHRGPRGAPEEQRPARGISELQSPIPHAKDSQRKRSASPCEGPLRAPRGGRLHVKDLFHLQEPGSPPKDPSQLQKSGSPRQGPRSSIPPAPSAAVGQREQHCSASLCGTAPSSSSPAGELQQSAKSRSSSVNCSGAASSCSSSVNPCTAMQTAAALGAPCRQSARRCCRRFPPAHVAPSVRVPSFQVKPQHAARAAAPVSMALGHSCAVGLRWEPRDPRGFCVPFCSSVLLFFCPSFVCWGRGAASAVPGL